MPETGERVRQMERIESSGYLERVAPRSDDELETMNQEIEHLDGDHKESLSVGCPLCDTYRKAVTGETDGR